MKKFYVMGNDPSGMGHSGQQGWDSGFGAGAGHGWGNPTEHGWNMEGQHGAMPIDIGAWVGDNGLGSHGWGGPGFAGDPGFGLGQGMGGSIGNGNGGGFGSANGGGYGHGFGGMEGGTGYGQSGGLGGWNAVGDVGHLDEVIGAGDFSGFNHAHVGHNTGHRGHLVYGQDIGYSTHHTHGAGKAKDQTHPASTAANAVNSDSDSNAVAAIDTKVVQKELAQVVGKSQKDTVVAVKGPASAVAAAVKAPVAAETAVASASNKKSAQQGVGHAIADSADVQPMVATARQGVGEAVAEPTLAIADTKEQKAEEAAKAKAEGAPAEGAPVETDESSAELKGAGWSDVGAAATPANTTAAAADETATSTMDKAAESVDAKEMKEAKEKEKVKKFTEKALAAMADAQKDTEESSKLKMEKKAPTLPLQNPVESFKDPPKNKLPPGPVPMNPNPTPGPSQVAKNLPTSANEVRFAKRNPKQQPQGIPKKSK